jgi:hypothetical protein
MIVNNFGDAETLAVTTSAQEIDSTLCGGQGLAMCNLIGSASTVVIATGIDPAGSGAGSTSAQYVLGYLLPGQDTIIPIQAGSTIKLYAYVASGTATVAYRGVN